MKSLAKYIATTKQNGGQNLQRANTTAHAQLVKWNKFQFCYKNRIKHFLPSNGNHPARTLQVIFEWELSKPNVAKDIDVPVTFPADVVRTYEALNKEYVPSAPVKTEEAKHIMKIIPLDIRFLLGRGYKFTDNEIVPDQTSASGSASQPPPATEAEGYANDRSPSPQRAPDPLNIVSWDPCNLEAIPWDQLVYSPDVEFTNNRSYHAAAILFFFHPELPLKYPQLKDAVHAGWMATFRHPMNFEELRRPPCVGDGAYTEEEQIWCKETIEYFVATLDAAGRQLRGIPESVPRRAGQRRAAAGRAGPGPAAAAAAPASTPASAPASVAGRAVPVAMAARGRSHGRAGGSGENEDDADGYIETQSDNEIMETTQASRRKRGKSQSRYPLFDDFLVMLVDIFHLF